MLGLDTYNGTPPPNRVELTSAADDIAIVSLIGEHDVSHYDSLKIVLARAAIRAPNVIVDLSECQFVDSTAISLLLHGSRVITRYGGHLPSWCRRGRDPSRAWRNSAVSLR